MKVSSPADRFLAAIVLTDAAQKCEQAAIALELAGNALGAEAMRDVAVSYRRVITDITDKGD